MVMSTEELYDDQLEMVVLASLVKDPRCIAEVANVLTPECFYLSANRAIFEKIMELWRDDEAAVDLVALAPTLQKAGIAVSEMTRYILSIPTTANIRTHAERLRLLASLRQAVATAKKLIHESGRVEDADDIRSILLETETKLSQLTAETVKAETLRPLQAAVVEFHDWLSEAEKKAKSGVTGIPSGFSELDRMLGGFQNGDLIIVAGRPGMGKTAFALQLALNMSAKTNAHGVFFSLEMSTRQLVQRLLSNVARIDLGAIRSARIPADRLQELIEASAFLGALPLWIDDQASMSVGELKAKARKVKHDRGLDYVIIDYLGLIRGTERGMTRYEQVSENVRQLKALAKELDVPVIVLSQLSRSVEQRQDKRPMLSDLRESGEIEQTADVVLFLYREDYYDAATERKNVVELLVAKHRNGPTGNVELAFARAIGRFIELHQYAWEGKNDGDSEAVEDR